MYKVFGIGEILWDLLPAGRQLGGAPANFAYHARALGADGRVISRVGADPLGIDILQHLRSLDIPCTGISVDARRPTGTVDVAVGADGQPSYIINDHVAWDHLVAFTVLQQDVASADAICFGSLAQRAPGSRAAIRTLVASAPAAALRVFDVNLRQDYYSREIVESSLGMANVLKLNDAELPILAAMFDIAGPPREQMAGLLERFKLCAVACTRGKHGSLILQGTEWCDDAGRPTQLADTIGAGDSFTAALTLGLLARWELPRISDLANGIAAFVCSQPGATPQLPPELRGIFAHSRAVPAVRR